MTTNAFAAGAYAAIQNMGRAPAAGLTGAGEGGFTQLLTSTLDGVAEAGKRADGQALAVAAGKANVVDVVTAVAESETALQTLVAVRDRVISAYEDIMRMQI
ncbi:flagellar hook-basal body complex protein FliE [Methylobacterium nonmethylotrophicum]|uniref:Flagellar hook-basal body complex protein FliE n=1 Tax=Methylobacterium nonmethylotrophicum TaxID=1141884 RepID=A0A4Z0NL90_9HYPH|nr:flagellar hook-basal body complex protein FliE [Methylobacterium nonmethylotrophicum]TGD96561.1 flagellar hook-basal body complex protein FliE [Methylobacterium nonmethylotrophicum]